VEGFGSIIGGVRRRDRIREWFADRIPWVQYPNIRPQRTPPKEHPIPIEWRWTYGLLFGAAALLSLAILAGVAVVLIALFWPTPYY